MFDILIKNALIVDGKGSPSFEGSVGIKGEKISAIGDLSESQAGTVIDANGLAVAPGFIDIHAHSEFTLLADPRGEGKVMQGVTTIVGGNCGASLAPLRDCARSFLSTSFRCRAFTASAAWRGVFHWIPSCSP